MSSPLPSLVVIMHAVMPPVMMGSYPSEPKVKTNSFFHKLLFMVFYHSNRKRVNTLLNLTKKLKSEDKESKGCQTQWECRVRRPHASVS